MSIMAIFVLGIVTTIMVTPILTPLSIQYAFALAPVGQITSAKADGTNMINGAFVTIAQGKTTVRVTFDYRGFDDNDHIVELRCSWDGINYRKSNCSTESAESRVTFLGPDGVSRAYYLKTGTASRELASPPVPKTYTFGVQVLNDGNDLSPPVTFSFKMRASTTSPNVGTQDGTGSAEPGNYLKRIKVNFDSITIYDDHDGFGFRPQTCCSGEWVLYAFVQGKLIKLLDRNVDDGKSYNLGKEITIDIKSYLPLSIFTYGADYDSLFGSCKFNEPRIVVAAAAIFTSPPTLWKQKIAQFQSDDDGGCDIGHDLGLVNDFYEPTGHGEGPHEVSSSSRDFTLRYRISVEPVARP